MDKIFIWSLYIIIISLITSTTSAVLVYNYLPAKSSSIATIDVSKLSKKFSLDLAKSANDSDSEKIKIKTNQLAEKILNALQIYSVTNNAVIFTNKQNIVGADDITAMVAASISGNQGEQNNAP